ncbi:hypothetical protein SERLADRAFT_439871 [Serpula lacrymans var. lacrymans S7.9]|uniref:CCHC-type domain-containing protein n=1 Tax=Serpula lacrymans var. lacrymans (strain S7.9) TaxID=578457 RepID=F8P1U9_SERL9|nr:uncharacterized protein SERLADRAFT_439871 [Serpula lacrymans var. lacrymans S7.9]EGO23127.1 hypothetical protein SERLADRAFT_439871 [Serpula lacrymans var. lacrymans S7.9]
MSSSAGKRLREKSARPPLFSNWTSYLPSPLSSNSLHSLPSSDTYKPDSSATLYTSIVSTSQQLSEEWVSDTDRRHQRDFLAALNKPLPVLPVPTEVRTPDAEEMVEQITELYQDSSALSSPIDLIKEIILDINDALTLTQAQRELLIFISLRHEQIPFIDYFESLVRPSYENTQRVKLLKGVANVQERNLQLILQSHIPDLLDLYRICPISFPDIPSRLLPYDFEHTLLCGIVLRKRPHKEPTYDIPSSFFTSDYYDTYSASPRKSRDGEDYTTEIDDIRYVSEYVDEYYWILEILTPFVVNQQSDHPERFIVTVLQSDFWAVINHSPQTRIYSQYSYTYQGRRGEASLIPTVEQLFTPCAERIEQETGSSLMDIVGGESSDKTESESEESTQSIEYWRPWEAEGGDFPKPRPLVTPDTPPPQSLGAAVEALEPDDLYQSTGPENFPPSPLSPEPKNQPDDWFNQESLDLEPDLAAAMTDETNQGSKAVLATPPFKFIGKKEMYVDWKNALANYFFAYPRSFQTNSSKILFALSRISSDKANDACHTWKANFNNKTAVLGDLFAPRNWGTISEFIKELDNEFLDPHLKLKAEIALHNYEQREMTVDAYFGGLESKLMEAGLSPDADESYPFIHSILRRNLSQFLRDRISQQENLPNTYLEWKAAARKWEQRNEELNLERRKDKPPQQRLPFQYQRYQPHYQQNQNYPPPQHRQTVPQTETQRPRYIQQRPYYTPSQRPPPQNAVHPNTAGMFGGSGVPMEIGSSNMQRQCRPNPNVTCYNCGKQGHIARNCPHGKMAIQYMETEETRDTPTASSLKEIEAPPKDFQKGQE